MIFYPIKQKALYKMDKAERLYSRVFTELGRGSSRENKALQITLIVIDEVFKAIEKEELDPVVWVEARKTVEGRLHGKAN